MNRTKTWVEWFCSTPQGKYFVQIDQNFIRDGFNFYGLRQYIQSNYKYAVEMIRDNYAPDNQRNGDIPQDVKKSDVEKSAIRLYGLLQARYLTTLNGLKEIKKKYQNHVFEACPRVSCNKVCCLPYGVSEEPDDHALKMYCPCCREVYTAEDEIFSNIDGAYFGHSYLLVFLQIYPEFVKTPIKTELKLFGFRIELDDDSESESEVE